MHIQLNSLTTPRFEIAAEDRIAASLRSNTSRNPIADPKDPMDLRHTSFNAMAAAKKQSSDLSKNETKPGWLSKEIPFVLAITALNTLNGTALLAELTLAARILSLQWPTSFLGYAAYATVGVAAVRLLKTFNDHIIERLFAEPEEQTTLYEKIRAWDM